MARFIPKKSFLNNVLTFEPTSTLQEISSIGGLAYRAKILLDREIRGFEKNRDNSYFDSYDHELTPSQGGGEKEHREVLEQRQSNSASDNIGSTYTSETPGQRTAGSASRDSISIIDIDHIPEDDAETRLYSYITLPFIPKELNYQPQSNFVGIASYGRNNPFYNYTGSEDTLSFTIDWFSSLNNRRDVIFYCRWLEALSKADGYSQTPHRIKLAWGGNSELFENDTWIVDSAPYRLSEFVNAYIEGNQIVKVGLLPQQAFQNIKLKKITNNNLSASEIIGNIRP